MADALKATGLKTKNEVEKRQVPLNKIAKIGLSHDGSVSGSAAKFDRQVNENSLLAELCAKQKI